MEIRYCIHSDGSCHQPLESIIANGDERISIIECPECGIEVSAINRREAFRMWNAKMKRRQLRAMREAKKR